MVVGSASRRAGIGCERDTVATPTQPGEFEHGPMALSLAAPTPLHPRESDVSHLAPHRIKRCTYRRLISIDRPAERLYEVECLYPDRKVPIPLGDLDTSLPICNACTALHIFRADED